MGYRICTYLLFKLGPDAGGLESSATEVIGHFLADATECCIDVTGTLQGSLDMGKDILSTNTVSYTHLDVYKRQERRIIPERKYGARVRPAAVGRKGSPCEAKPMSRLYDWLTECYNPCPSPSPFTCRTNGFGTTGLWRYLSAFPETCNDLL